MTMRNIVFLISCLIVLWAIGGCAQTPKRLAMPEPARHYPVEQAASAADQGVRVLSVRPSPEQVEEKKTTEKPAIEKKASEKNESHVVIPSISQPVAHEDKNESQSASPDLTEGDITKLIPGHVSDRNGWARDITKTFSALNLPPSASNVCAVLAVIQQESGFQPNPPVKGMVHIIKSEIDKNYGGELGNKTFQMLLDVKPDNERVTYWDRLMKARTEYDVDRVFRDYLVYHEVQHSSIVNLAGFTGKAFGINDLDVLNPITTIGSMQVSVRFSQEQAGFNGMSAWQTREFLYTRYGGIYYGTLRLLGYQANYTDPIYRFADYNLGMYASRNVAIQQQLSALVGYNPALDGDLLSYSKGGSVVLGESNSEKVILAFAKRYAPALDNKAIHNDLRLEKTAAFENTNTYLAIKQAYAAMYGAAPYARLPEVEIHSPKISSKFSTARFAGAVNGKYLKCIKAHNFALRVRNKHTMEQQVLKSARLRNTTRNFKEG